MELLKPAFLDTARYYAALGKHDGQYASLLTFAALDPGDTFTTAELAAATRALPPEGLHDAVRALVRALEGAGDQRADYWSNRVTPYIRAIWPKTRDNISPAIAKSIGRLCVAAQDAFPEALALLQYWLQPIEHPDYVVHLLHESGLCSRFPADALRLLDAIIADQQWAPWELGQCLDSIEQVSPELAQDSRFQRLRGYSRRRGSQ